MVRQSAWEPNPIIVKELRSRMRGGRAFLTLTVTLLLFGLLGYGLYRMALVGAQNIPQPLSPLVGQILFGGLAFCLLITAAAVAPSITAAAISGEKEKLTYDMLLATPLQPNTILWGKLVASLSYLFLLIFTAIPMSSLVFTFGGVSIRDMLKALIVVLVFTILFGVIGLFLSALLGRSGRATAAAYLVVLFLLFGPLFISIAAGVLRQSDPPRWMLALSPISALASALAPSINPNNISSMFWMLGSPIYWVMGSPPISITTIPRPVYHYSVPLYGLLAIILYMLTTRLVLTHRRWHIRWSEALLAVIILLGYIGIVGLAYMATTPRYENILATRAGQQDGVLIEPTATPDSPLTPEGEPSAPAPKGLRPLPENRDGWRGISPSQPAGRGGMRRIPPSMLSPSSTPPQ